MNVFIAYSTFCKICKTQGNQWVVRQVVLHKLYRLALAVRPALNVSKAFAAKREATYFVKEIH